MTDAALTRGAPLDGHSGSVRGNGRSSWSWEADGRFEEDLGSLE